MTKRDTAEVQHKPICPICGGKMQRLYIRSYDQDSRPYIGVGWICQDPHCNHIARD